MGTSFKPRRRPLRQPTVHAVSSMSLQGNLPNAQQGAARLVGRGDRVTRRRPGITAPRWHPHNQACPVRDPGTDHPMSRRRRGYEQLNEAGVALGRDAHACEGCRR